jgi:hypothetical protein
LLFVFGVVVAQTRATPDTFITLFVYYLRGLILHLSTWLEGVIIDAKIAFVARNLWIADRAGLAEAAGEQKENSRRAAQDG